MNRHQQIALQFHCRLAAEVIHPRFNYSYMGVYQVKLTVNTGYE